MSRLTGTDAYGLMEAYQAVYAPQELTEEQVWEEVENWVNSLLEEGYDLSDYTWEEMYEEYLEEIYGTNLGGNTKTKPNKLDTAVGNAIKSITSSGADATPRTTGIYGQPTRKPASPTFQNTGGFGRYAPPSTQVKTPAPAAPAKRTLRGRELVQWKYQRYMQDYLACVQGVDDSVGEVLDYLDRTGLAKNTVVIYTSDNGRFHGSQGLFDKALLYLIQDVLKNQIHLLYN